MSLPKANTVDVLSKVVEESRDLGVEPERLFLALTEVLGAICLGEDKLSDLRIKGGQELVASVAAKDYSQAQELSARIGLEKAELRGASSAEKRISDAIQAAQVRLNIQEGAA